MTMGLGYTVRLVRTQEELREKAAIFHMGLDDRAVEVMKYLLRDQIDAVTGEKELKAVWCMPDGEDAMFEIFTEDGDLYPLTGALEPCRKLQAAIQEDLPEHDEALTVDRAWAEEFLNSLKK